MIWDSESKTTSSLRDKEEGSGLGTVVNAFNANLARERISGETFFVTLQCTDAKFSL